MPRAKKTTLSTADHKVLEDTTSHSVQPITAPARTRGFFRFLVVGVLLGGISGVIAAASVISFMYNDAHVSLIHFSNLPTIVGGKDTAPVPSGSVASDEVRASWGDVFAQSSAGEITRLGGAFALTSDGWFLVPAQVITSTVPVRLYYQGVSYPVEKKQAYGAYPEIGFAKISSTSVRVTQLDAGDVVRGRVVNILDAQGYARVSRVVASGSALGEDEMTDSYLPPAFVVEGQYDGVAFAFSPDGKLAGVAGSVAGASGVTGFASIDVIKKHLSLLAGQSQQGVVGVSYVNGFSPRNRAFVSTPADGFIVTGFVDGRQQKSPARVGGLKVGDIITSFDGAPIDGKASLYELLAGRQPKTVVPLEIKRGTDIQKISITLG